MDCAPWLPPKIRIVYGAECVFAATDLNSGRTGFPVTTARDPKYARVLGSVTAAKFTQRPRVRFASPGIEFCSMISRGYRPRIAAVMIGNDAYPPTPITASGLNSCRILFAF